LSAFIWETKTLVGTPTLPNSFPLKNVEFYVPMNLPENPQQLNFPTMYSAIVLSEKSHEKLVKWANENVRVNNIRLPVLVERVGWKMHCHHMTIQFPGTPDFIQQYVGSEQKLEAIALGISDMAVAVRVVGFHSDNKIAHVTVAVNAKAGGKPVMSNQITNWTKIPVPLKLSGTVEELT
jgi:hypothetical protein